MDQELVVKQVEAIIEPQEEAPDLEVKKIVGQEPEIGQTRLGQLYNYVRVLNELESVKSEKEAYEAK